VKAHTFSFRTTLTSVRTLALGILAGALLTTSFDVAKSVLAGPGTLVPPSAVAEASLLFSLYYALVISIVCVPVWLGIKRLGLASPIAAALLGFAVTLAVWTADNLGAPFTPLEVMESGVPYALFAGAAGLVMWWSNSTR
jgi:hypothetical protein